MEGLTGQKFETTPKINAREEVSLEIALEIQRKLIMAMIPRELLSFLDNDIENKILDMITMRWMEKYALDFNGFTEFCNLNAENEPLMSRITTGTLNENDLSSMVDFLEHSSEGGKFFTDEELRNFIAQISH